MTVPSIHDTASHNTAQSGQVALRFFAGAAEAAGATSVELRLNHEMPLQQFVAELPQRLTESGNTGTPAADFSQVCAKCSFLLNAVRADPATAVISPGDNLDVLPPFAGG